MGTVIDQRAADRRTQSRSAGIPWYALLAVGVAFTLFALAIPQFDMHSLKRIAVVLGIVLLLGAASEVLAAGATARDWRWSHLLLAALFVVGGIVALVWPDPTFKVVARTVAWFFLIKGVYDIINSFAARRSEQHAEAEADGRAPAQWWMPLVVGALEIGVAFWAVGYPRDSRSLLALWVGLAALALGLTKIAMALRLRGVRAPAPLDSLHLDDLTTAGFGGRAVAEGGRLEGGRAQRATTTSDRYPTGDR
ncbi:hypothetical protein FF36_04662 [Frankia torreyi]|uniref:DUF308 domain-containing protein n=2 Tax=Frankia TaxID=1854 RepID=A0A0D8BCE4_9ACTN|nr:hypothetical protein FF36_04662 [Frankia torreyi]KQM04118.1 hypothetical protein FF86_103042 [Frankia sp. CpI1-P]